MHDLIFAVAFIAMVASPAMVAAIGGRKEYDPGPVVPRMRPAPPVRSLNVRHATLAVRPRSTAAVRRTPPAHRRLVFVDGPTLPLHNARGMAGR